MPTAIVGLHLGLAAVIAALGLAFLLNPCAGDLCLGGIAALTAFAAAGVVLVGLAVWKLGRRASPLLVLDAALLAFGVYLLDVAQYGAPEAWLGAVGFLGLGTPGAILAGRAVAAHRIESVVAVGLFVAAGAMAANGGGLSVAAAGLLALAAGWLTRRLDPGAPSDPPPAG